jgi:hypothetical protein
MALIFLDGFDKYRRIASALYGGDWNTYLNITPQNGTSFTDGAYQGDAFVTFQDSGLYKSLPGNYKTIIWGLRFYIPGPLLNAFAVIVGDGMTNQMTVRVNSSGFIEIRRGSQGGPVFGLQASTLLDTSTTSISIGTWHYLEAKITIDNTTGAYDVYLDGDLIISNTNQDTQVTGNAYVNSFLFFAVDFQNGARVDDLYIFDDSGDFNNDVVGDVVVETQFPASDASVQFSVGASAFGAYYALAGSGNSNPGANTLFLRTFTPIEDCIINSVSTLPASSTPSSNFKAVIYADNSGAPGALMSDGTEVNGALTDVVLTGPLTTPQNLTGGTPYWLGFITDTNTALFNADGLNLYGFQANNTYTSGAPANAPVMLGNRGDWMIWGNVTSTFNYAELQSPVSDPLVNYITNTSVGDEDQYNFPPLSTVPLNVYAVKVSAYAAKSDAGSRNISLMVDSGGTDDPGDNPSQALTASYQYYTSFFEFDPHTGLPWTYGTVNAATSGVKVDS